MDQPQDAGGNAAPAAADQAVSCTEFSRIYGCDEAYIRRLRDRGRLVLDDQRRVLVDASLRKIAETRDLAKVGVVERWNAHRAARGLPPAVELQGSAPMQQAAPAATSATPAASPAPSAFHQAQTALAATNAAIRGVELRKMSGELAEWQPMARAMADVVTASRDAVLGLPDRLEGVLNLTPAQVEQLRAECERVCDTMHRTLLDAARKAGAPDVRPLGLAGAMRAPGGPLLS
jgi:pyruvate/2-oxoglutarate dehydrogenase complex dihydrolipoamide acyltransferase (E2) component